MQADHFTYIRHELRLSKQGLATALGVSYAAVHRYEKGLRPIPQVIVNLLAHLLEIYDQTGGFLDISKPRRPSQMRRRKPDESRADYYKEMTR